MLTRFTRHSRNSGQRFAPRSGRAAFTLVEALMSMTLLAIAGTALLLGASSALQTTNDSLDRTIANGLAQQLMDEIASGRYADVGAGAYQVTLGPSATELAGTGRERFDAIDDFNGVSTTPPKDLWGVEVGRADGQGGERHANFRAGSSFFDHWRQSVSVYYVSNADQSVRLAAGQTSNYRAAEVVIYYDLPTGGSRELARLRRVFAYIPNGY